MTRPDPTRAQLAHVSDALSFFVGKTLATIAEEAGEPTYIAKRVVDEGVERGSVERQGNRYRIAHEGPWLSTEPPALKYANHPATRDAPTRATEPPTVDTPARPEARPRKPRTAPALSREIAALLGADGDGADE